MTEEDKTDKSREQQKPVPDLKPKKDVKGGGKPVSPGSKPPSIEPVPPLSS
jgi:hypothetical protein